MVEQVLRPIAVSAESGRDLGHQIFQLRILNSRQKRLRYGIDHGVVKIHLLLKECPIERRTLTRPALTHRCQVCLCKREIAWRGRCDFQRGGQVASLLPDNAVITGDHLSKLRDFLRASSGCGEGACLNIEGVGGIEYRDYRGVVELGLVLLGRDGSSLKNQSPYDCKRNRSYQSAGGLRHATSIRVNRA